MTSAQEDDLILTRHAREVMQQRCITLPEVVETLRDYENRYQSTKHDGIPREGVFVFQRGRLAVVAADDGPLPVVITVLLRADHTWTNEEVVRRHD